MDVQILRTHDQSEAVHEESEELRCPICGSKVFISRDIVDGFDFGWSIGCPRYKLNDGIHGHDENTPEEETLTIFWCGSREDAVKKWKERMKRLKGVGILD